ncbi:MAG: amidohydrolase family protein [Dehalococcoidia bacterium]|nr:amidohydrolase family protein [Dehalococcoidia bacterium]
MAQTVNDILGDLCAENPTRFLGFASVPLPHVDAAIDELRRAMSKPGMVGAVLGTNILGMPLDAEEFQPFFEEANRLGLPLFVHPAAPRAMVNPEEYVLGPMVGFPFETVLTALRLGFSGTLDRFPDINLVFCHLGGAIPFLYGRFDSSFSRHPKAKFRTSTKPSDHLRRHYYDTALAFWAPPFRCGLEFLGPDHIVLGTDHPLALGEMAPTVRAIESFDISGETKEKIFSENARRILNVPEVMLEAHQLRTYNALLEET